MYQIGYAFVLYAHRRVSKVIVSRMEMYTAPLVLPPYIHTNTHSLITVCFHKHIYQLHALTYKYASAFVCIRFFIHAQ